MREYQQKLIVNTSPVQAGPMQTALRYINAGIWKALLPSEYDVEDKDELSWMDQKMPLNVNNKFCSYGLGSTQGYNLDIDLVKFWEVWFEFSWLPLAF